MRKIGRLHVITDSPPGATHSHVEVARMAIAGGADVIQFRDKHMPFTALVDTAREVRRMCHRAKRTFIVNDRVDVALAVEADGVHLGAEDLPVTVARRLLGPRRIIGASASTPPLAARAHADGANYVGVGHVFPTRSKSKSTTPIGAAGVGWVAVEALIPVIAIGGIDASNLGQVLEYGAHGVAVIGAVCRADDPEAATRLLRDALDMRQS